MTTDDLALKRQKLAGLADDLQHKRQKLAVLSMLEVSFRIARKFKVCPTCLVYAAAHATRKAEERGDAVHGLCDTPDFIHPPHQTIV
jgi:uncharacterized protein with PIN domain